jgi:hypothetical protein
MSGEIESVKGEIESDRLKFGTHSIDHKRGYMALLREYTLLLNDAHSEWKKAFDEHRTAEWSVAKWKKKESIFEKYMALSRYLATGSWIHTA